MVWPFDDFLRPFVRMAAYLQGAGYTPTQVMEWAAGSRHAGNLADMREALPEGRRANYLMERIRAADPTLRFSTIWGRAARATWYAGYGRAPTPAEREWAYTRPQEVLGLTFEVTGRGAESGRFRHYTITVNVPWSANLGEVEDFLRNELASGRILTRDFGSEPLRPDSIIFALSSGALLARQQPTATMPGA